MLLPGANRGFAAPNLREASISQYNALLAAATKSESETFNSLDRWMAEHLKEDLRVDALAERVHMSPLGTSHVLMLKSGAVLRRRPWSDLGRTGKAASRRNRTPDRVHRRGLWVQQREADAVLFHQDFRNPATRVSKALCHHRLISVSVVVGAKASGVTKSISKCTLMARAH
jgi:hypothetical protein